MSLVERCSDARSAPGDARDIERDVEGQLTAELRIERGAFARQFGDIRAAQRVLVDFDDWCDAYRLPGTAPVMATYLLRLHHRHGASRAEIKEVAGAYLIEHAWTVRVLIRAVMRHCAVTPPREIADHHTRH